MAALAAAAVPLSAEKTSDGSVEEKWRGRSGDEDAGEEQCELMMEALRRELDEIKNQLAWLTYHLGESSSPAAAERGIEENDGEHVRSSSSRLSGGRSGADTPHTAKKKMEKVKEAIERATKAALAEKERKKHFLEVVDRAENAQRRYNEEYTRLLQAHVEQQREVVQENSRRLLRKMRTKERKEKALRLQSKPARFRSLPSNDESSFLNKLYHSTYYQIIGIELKMRKAGKLQRLSDMKEFWELMLDLPSHHPPPPPPPPPPRLSHGRVEPTLHKPHPRLAEEGEEEEHTSWALTDLPPEHNTREIHSSERDTGKSQSFSEPLRLPQVSPIASLLNNSSSSREQDKEKVRAHKKKIESAERSRQHTRHMYQQARANEMAMRKLLPDIGSLGLNMAEENSTTCDTPQTVSSKLKAHPGLTSSGKSTSVKEAKLGSRKKSSNFKFQQNEDRPTPQEMESILEEQNLSQSSAAAREKERDTPLTMNSLLDTGTVKKPKGKSVLWSNYQ